jgi:putative radical SAM-modified peptide
MEHELMELEVLDEGRDDCEELVGCCSGSQTKK